MDPDDSGDDAAALRARVDALEQTVSEQQATIEELASPTASRRGVLAALTGVAGAGALGAYSQRASAQAAGQVGTSAEPVDIYANKIQQVNSFVGAVDTEGETFTDPAGNTFSGAINGIEPKGYVDESANRTIGTEYQNNKNAPIEVKVRFQSTSSTGLLNPKLLTGGVSGNLQTTETVRLSLSSGQYDSPTRLQLSAIVGAGGYYKATDANTPVEVDKWAEQKLL